VTRDVPAHTIVAGNPARILRKVQPADEQPGSPSPAEPAAIPFLDLRRQHAPLKPELLRLFADALDQAGFIGGPPLEKFQEAFAHFTECRFALGVASGTDALRFGLLALGVQPGTSVVTVPNTFIATAAAITQAGGAVEFVDVDPDTCLMEPNRLEDHLKKRFANLAQGPRPAVILPVHLYGQCTDMTAIVSLGRRFGMKVLEDAAQAHGSTQHGKAAGSLGDAAAFSFYPGKNLGACGEGGAVTTNDPVVADLVHKLRDHGRTDRYSHSLEGYNGRLDAIQAGFLNAKLPHLADWNACRRKWAALYDAGLAGLRTIRRVRVRPENVSNYHLYVVRSADRLELQAELAARGIASGIHYPIPLHRQECYRRLGLPAGAFPEAERACAEVLSLPMFPEMDAAQVERVVAAVRHFEQQVSSKRAA